ncbi:endonuclease/exonuclease/phosphatase family protein [Sanguibacter suaedae]|uniref:Endonuclease/exonuclease/phosphatase family protein n=1 Tax=Sanguibacter suaedae TaxID=2795737 RepID=A0A934IB14_9MICO|nr:endonuclease/exonuclease/phosphatase family protein [Sanguibacter suaedae]MBI9115147.1 endonuclease/exonuclease/phosphatase family protein [Sanguibacter suaedae]
MTATTAPGQRASGRPAATLVALLAVVTTITAEMIRASGPLIDHAFTTGVASAAATALVTYAAPGALVAALALAVRRPPDGRTLLAAVAVLAAARLLVQVLDGSARHGVGLVTVAISLTVLTLTAAAAARVSGQAVATGVALGVLTSASINLALGTWDAVWRHGPAGWAVTLATCGAVVVLAVRCRDLPSAGTVRGLWIVGPYLSLAVMVFANPAFVSSQSGLPLWASGVVLLLAGVVVAALLARPAVRVDSLPPVADVVLVVVGVGAAAVVLLAPTWPRIPTGALSLAVAGSAALLAPVSTQLLAQALTRPAHPQGWPRLAGVASALGLTTALPLLVYQLDYDIPLPWPNAAVPVVVAGVLALMGLRARRRTRSLQHEITVDLVPLGRRALTALVAVPATLLVLGTTLLVVPAGPGPTDRPAGTVRMLSWNVHYGVSGDPDVPLDEIVDVVRESGADVVALQEVSRGWVMGGGVDMATYLSRHLGMRFVFVPAADHQFGNAVLWRSTMGAAIDVRSTELPYGMGPQRRSAISVGIDTGAGEVRVTSVHLQHRAPNTPTRLEQIRALVAAEPVVGPYVLAGTLNAEPGWLETRLLSDEGLTSAVDVAGDPSSLTHPSRSPDSRVDWLYGAGLRFGDTTVLDSTESDHRPIVTTLTVTP